MTGLHYSIVSEKMVWIWYHDNLGNKHLKELFGDDAAAFVERTDAGNKPDADGSVAGGTEFLKQHQKTS